MNRYWILFFVISVELTSCQIHFPGQSDSGNEELKEPISGDGGGDSDNKLMSLLRLSPSSVVANRGMMCRDPNLRNGVCSYIGDPQCAPFLEALVGGHGRRRYRQTLNYIRRATSDPCGFDGNDITMCCPGKANPTISTTTTAPTGQLLPKECGVRVVEQSVFKRSPQQKPPRVFIIGGIQAPEGKWPWAVILGRPEANTFKVVCGGTLITNQHVLTAAHCFPDNTDAATKITHVRLGEQDLSSSDGIAPVDVEVCDVRKHENYALATEVKNDITILKLCHTVDFGKYIQPACLPSNGQEDPSGALTVVGWGSEKLGGGAVTALREADVVRVSLSECQQRYSAVGGKIDSSHICAGKGATDTCAGDSGGPMLTESSGAGGGRWTVVGVTSFGVGCANENFPGVYTNVAKFLDWIKAKLY